MSEKPIQIVAVAGSVRPGNFTGKALRLVADEIAESEDATVTQATFEAAARG